MKDHCLRTWPWLAGAAVLFPLLMGGVSWFPEILSNLRYPLLGLTTISLLFIFISPGVRAHAREILYAPEKIIANTHEKRIAIAIFAYFFIFLAKAAYQDYRSFSLNAVDFSTFDYFFYNTQRGNYFQTLQGVNYFGVHASPILLLLVPLHRLFGHPLFLHFFYSFLLWASAIPFYLLLERNLPVSFHRLLLLVGYFLFSYFGQVFGAHFHPEGFYPILFFTFFLCLQDQKWGGLALTTCLLLAVKETSAIYLMGIAAGSLFWERYAAPRLLPVYLILVCIVVYLFDTGWLIPNFFSAGRNQLADLASPYGATIAEIGAGLAARPAAYLQDLALAVIPLGAGFVFVPWLIPFTFFAMVPFFTLQNISASSSARQILGYHAAGVIPLLFFGYLLYIRQPNLPGTKRPFWAPLKNGMIFFSFLYFALIGPGYLQIHKTNPDYLWLTSVRHEVDFRKTICAQASVLPHLPYAPQMKLLGTNCLAQQPFAIVLHPESSAYPLTTAEWKQIYQTTDRNPLYVKRRFGNIIVFQKRG